MCPRPRGQGQPLASQLGCVFHSPCLWSHLSSGWFQAPLSVLRTSKGSSPQSNSQHPSASWPEGDTSESLKADDIGIFVVWVRRNPGLKVPGLVEMSSEDADPWEELRSSQTRWVVRAALCYEHHKRAPLHQKRRASKRFSQSHRAKKGPFHVLLLV